MGRAVCVGAPNPACQRHQEKAGKQLVAFLQAVLIHSAVAKFIVPALYVRGRLFLLRNSYVIGLYN